ncbi:MAG: dihydroorotate dehydrogenase electron transfer subunit [Acidobacteriota bacterium]|nr:MAG: dihydroorotate dehydrogenase electron transfer subunit [Acidobacteriota bacterium]
MTENRDCTVAGQRELGEDYFLLQVAWPELANQVCAGQFVMLGLPDIGEMLIRRPFSVARTVASEPGRAPCSFEILYKVYGRATRAFSRLRAGAVVSVLGPLGRGFWLPDESEHDRTEIVLVAGGIGNAPFPLLLQQLGPRAQHVSLFFGGRSREDLTLLSWFRERCQVITTTEDGSEGRRALVTEPLAEKLDDDPNRRRVVLACGPQPMLKAVAEICLAREVLCQLALEETIACGFGVCLGCVVEQRHPASEFERYVRVCTEGPVFDAREVIL